MGEDCWGQACSLLFLRAERGVAGENREIVISLFRDCDVFFLIKEAMSLFPHFVEQFEGFLALGQLVGHGCEEEAGLGVVAF